MREVMHRAEVGDDVWREDPVAPALEARAAELLGKAAALFVPSGTMANQIALLLHCQRGDEVIVGRGAHIRIYESGAGSAWAGVQCVEVGGPDGTFDVAALEAAIGSSDIHAAPTRLVAIENTHNRGGGTVWDDGLLEAVTTRARERGLALHLDGARLWNASVATGRSEQALAAPFDTVSACFSKGLGAPVGSVLAGSGAAISKARRYRKMLGGGMRQIGMLCAAALHALDHHRARLKDDHVHARRLAEGLAEMPGVTIDPASVRTNIVLAGLDRMPAGELVALASAEGVRIAAVGPHHVRAVTHLDVDEAGIARALLVLRSALRRS